MKTMFIIPSAMLLLLASCNSDKTQVIDKLVYVKERDTSKTNTDQPVEIKKNDEASIAKKRIIEFNPDFSNFEEFNNNLNKYMIHAQLNGQAGEFTLYCETQSSPHDKKKFQKQFGINSLSADLMIDLNDIQFF
jgi:hypothetical protein